MTQSNEIVCTSYDDLVKVLEAGKRLTLQKVELHRANKRYTSDALLSCQPLEALVLVCNHYHIYIACDGETDEINIVGNPQFIDPVRINLSQQEPWRSALGRDLFIVWELMNNRGYDDGLQLQFGSLGQEIRILVDGAASQIRTWILTPC